ncbi:MAG: PAS domain-containing sensor histidine kinase [Candidatus Shapirobacteria bacterium]|jgi:PAS domain S-box-containing protein
MLRKNTQATEKDILDVLMENTDAHLAYLDNNFNFLKVNSAYAKGSGVLKKDLIGKNHFDLFPSRENQKIFEKVRKSGRTVRYRAKPFVNPVDPEKMTTYWDWSLTPIKDGEKKVIGLVFSLMNVTDYKRTEENLRRSEGKYRKLFDNMVDAFAYHKMIFDQKGKPIDYVFLEFNRAFEVATGLKKKTAIGKRVTEVLPGIKDGDFDWIGKYGQVAKTGKKIKFERYFEPLNKWFSITAYCPRKGYFATTFKDITGRINTEKKLKHLASFPRFNPEPVLELDFAGQVTYANASVYQVLKEAWLGQNARLFLPTDIGEIVDTLRKRNGVSSVLKEVKVGNKYFDLKIYHLVKLGLVRIYGHDITNRKKIEQQKDEFFSIASHELKTPLTSIKAFLQLIQRTCKGVCNPQMGHYHERVAVQIDKLTHLINDLLDISKIQSKKMEMAKEKIKIDKLIQEVAEDVQMTASNGHEIIVKSKVGATILGDSYRIGQVLSNLLVNAVKYSPDANRVEVSAKRKDGMVVISVKDFGLGIAKDKQKKIFERFYQIQPSPDFLGNFSSLGLGLFISAEIVRNHGGKIGLRSETGKGSTFYFSLPEKN